ncbi:MAG: hypothetical protein QW650_07910 [Thermofilum sp.]
MSCMAGIVFEDWALEDLEPYFRGLLSDLESLESRYEGMLDHFLDNDICDDEFVKFTDDLFRDIIAAAEERLKVIKVTDYLLGFDYDFELGGAIAEVGGTRVQLQFLLAGWNYSCGMTVKEVYDTEGFEIVVYVRSE